MSRLHTFTKEEILAKTGIRLDKEWDIFITPFVEVDKDIHADECAHLKFGYSTEVVCTCEPKIIPSVFTRLLGWGEKYFQCNIWEEKEDIPDKSWELPYNAILEVPILAEDIKNALDTTAEMLKAYEISGNTAYDFFTLKLQDGQILEGKEMHKLLYS